METMGAQTRLGYRKNPTSLNFRKIAVIISNINSGFPIVTQEQADLWLHSLPTPACPKIGVF